MASHATLSSRAAACARGGSVLRPRAPAPRRALYRRGAPSGRPVEVQAFGFLKDKLGLEKPGWLPAFNKEKRRKEVDAQLAAGEPVVVGPDYTVGAAFLGAGSAFNAIHLAPLGVPLVLLGGLFAFQASQVKFVFDKEAMEVRIGEDLQQARENWAVGGENRWKYTGFTNWTFFPANAKDGVTGGEFPFPILVYFKETETPREKWSEGPGKFDKNPGTGQMHFFPAVVDADEIAYLFDKKGCARQ
eukprot:jgi/Tetstr1/440442/TSEL_028775.t1